MTESSPALLKLFAFGALALLLADIGLVWISVAGRLRGKPLLSRRWSAAHVLIAFQAWLLPTLLFTMFAAALAALAAPGSPAETLLSSPAMQWVFISGLIVQNLAMVGVVLFIVSVVYDQHLIAAGLSLRRWGPRALVGFLAAGVVIPLNEGLERLSRVVLPHASLPGLLQHAFDSQMAQFMGMFRGSAGLAWGLLLIGIIGPLGEEVFFRGFAYRCFRHRWGPVVGMLFSAALFSLVHLDPAGLLPIFAVGCALAYLYERTGTLAAPFTLHAVNNIVAVLMAHFAHGH